MHTPDPPPVAPALCTHPSTLGNQAQRAKWIDSKAVQAQKSLRTRRSDPFRVRPYPWLALAAAIGLAFATVLLMGGGHAHAPEMLGAHSPSLRTSTPVAHPSLSAEFALLRTAAPTPLPPAYLRAVQSASSHYALVPSAARESREGVWLVPGRDGLCLMMLDEEGVGGHCVSRAVAESDGVSFVVRNTRSGQELVTGAVPDGIVRVRALASNGATLATAIPRSSIYRLTAKNIRKMSTDR